MSTGRPVRVANSTHANAPVETDSGKRGDSAKPPVTRPVLKVRSSAVVNSARSTSDASSAAS